ncbi:MAG: cytosolic protein [Proteobacteria bacterium]|nr:cytosolic protein [Pseudomonadota bacterium]MCL2307543.1 cytosolic protein [Pseudomonadota bacterium]
MENKQLKKIGAFIEQNIRGFHETRNNNLLGLRLDTVLLRKNPYLFRAKNINTASGIVENLLSAHLSSQEETLFGGFLERVAIFVCEEIFGGKKSSAEGIDLEFKRENIYYIVAIKSGPNWGNSQQIKRMLDNFSKAKRVLGTNRSRMNVVPVNGCCYGRDNQPDKGSYLKLCGERFWELISGSPVLYLDLIEPLGRKAKEKNEAFSLEYQKTVNLFTKDFLARYCLPDGTIDWETLVKLNAAAEKPGQKKERRKK